MFDNVKYVSCQDKVNHVLEGDLPLALEPSVLLGVPIKPHHANTLAQGRLDIADNSCKPPAAPSAAGEGLCAVERFGVEGMQAVFALVA